MRGDAFAPAVAEMDKLAVQIFEDRVTTDCRSRLTRVQVKHQNRITDANLYNLLKMQFIAFVVDPGREKYMESNG